MLPGRCWLGGVNEPLRWRDGENVLVIEAWGANSVRVRAGRGEIRDDLPSALLPPCATGECLREPPGVQSAEVSGSTLIVGDLRVTVDDRGLVRFCDAAGREVLAEHPAYVHFPGPRDLRPDGRVEQRFRAYPDERLYGLGQHLHGLLDQKGAVVDLVQRNGEVSIPFLLSSRGYGLLWNNPAIGRVELATTFTRWVADRAPQIDYWFTLGATPGQVLSAYADATGHAPEFPAWAAGLWQSKLRYRTQEELLTVAREYRDRGIPVAVIVADFFHWTRMGDWRFDPECWPDPAAMVAELAAMGTKLMVSVWPTVNTESENFAELLDLGLLVRDAPDGSPAERSEAPGAGPASNGSVYLHSWPDNGTDGVAPCAYLDVTQPAARAFLWDRLRDNYHALGIDTFWLDACEPDLPEHAAEQLRYAEDGDNLYPVRHAQGVFEGQRAAAPGVATVNLIRSAWAGSQRYGVAMWSGDIQTTFASLAQQIPAGLNVGLSGLPWWNTDIGGFHGGDPADPEFRELLVRWFQFGVFTTLLRMHGDREPRTRFFSGMTGGPNELWTYGEAEPILRDWLDIRLSLRDYLGTAMAEASQSGLPLMRALLLEFPGDPRCWEVSDQFMFGGDLLVAPITAYGARSREVYLPAGESWVDCFTGSSFDGGQAVQLDAPLERIPVLRRASRPAVGEWHPPSR